MLNGGKIFINLNVANFYLEVDVAEESRGLLTVITHSSLFQYNCQPFRDKATQSNEFHHIGYLGGLNLS